MVRTKPVCAAYADSRYDVSIDNRWRVDCDLPAGHHGDHLDLARSIHWRHQVPVPS